MRLQSMSSFDKPNKWYAILCLIPFIMTVYLLSNFPTDAANWEVAVFFIIIGVFAIIMTYIIKDKGLDENDIPFISVKDGGKDKEALDKNDFVVFGAVFVGILLAAFFLSQIHPLLSLIAGGFMLQYLLMKTQTIIIPWIAHGLFNTIIFVMSTYSLVPGLTLYSTGIFVPAFSNVFDDTSAVAGRTADITSTLTMQFAGVALMEESMKVSTALGFSVLFRGLGRTGSLTISTVLWILAHTVITYRV